MAVIQYSALLTQLRGKLGGSQFNKTFNGYSLQRKASQPRRDSPGQAAQRQRMQLVQRSWKTESQSRQSQAQQAANSNPVSDRFGQEVRLSGYQHYVKMMTWRLMGARFFDDPIHTLPVNSAELQVTVNSLSVSYDELRNVYVFGRDWQRTTVGTPTLSASGTRGFIFITQVYPTGRPLPYARRVYLGFVAYSDNVIVSDVELPVTGVSYSSGDYLLFEVITRNLYAGAVTGSNSQIIQLA